MRKRRILSAMAMLLAMVMLASTSAFAARAENPEEAGFIPIRVLFEGIGGIVDWQDEDRSIHIAIEGGTIILFADQTAAYVNDTAVTLQDDIILWQGISFIAEDDLMAMLDAFTATLPMGEENLLTIGAAVAEHSEILSIASAGGYTLQGRLTMPQGNDEVCGLVIFINGSGPQSFLTRVYVSSLGNVNLFDIWAKRFLDDGVAFFSSSTRGVTVSTEPPAFVEVDIAGYATYRPSNSIEDVYHIIRYLQANPRLADSKIFLLGYSEGGFIASLFEETHPGVADVLLLTAPMLINGYDLLYLQLTGQANMMVLSTLFEVDEYLRISEEAFYAGPWEAVFGASFADSDLNGDGFICGEDINIILGQEGLVYDVFNAIHQGDDEWIMENVPSIPLSQWFHEYKALRCRFEVLPELDLPIYVFQGTMDVVTPITEVFRLQEIVDERGSSNFEFIFFPGYGHDMAIATPQSVFHGEVPAVVRAITDAVNARLGRS